MAISKEIWSSAKTLYESGRLSLSEISTKTGIDKSSISKKAKVQQWKSGENADYIDAKILIAKKNSTLPIEKINTLTDLANDEIRRQSIILNATEKIIQRATEMLDKNKVDDKLNVGDGIQNYEPRELNTSDLKNLIDTIDKASICLKVNERFAPKQDINLNNNNQVITVEIE